MVAKVRSKTAIANAKRAYQRSKAIYATPEWAALANRGAKPQRLLWASTGTKVASLPDTYYVDTIIGRDTVNTMPPATMNAFRDHGKATPDTIETDLEGAEATLKALDQLGISLDEVTDELVIDGGQEFSDAFDKLLGGGRKKAPRILRGPHAGRLSRPATKPLSACFTSSMKDVGLVHKNRDQRPSTQVRPR